MIARFSATSAVLLVASLGCSSNPAPSATGPTQVSKSGPAPTTSTKITAFSVSKENLVVDKVGLRDGLFRPDGNRDLAFTATIDGAFETLFVVSTNAKGEPATACAPIRWSEPRRSPPSSVA